MIHIVTSANRHLYRRQVWAMFEGRRLAFVERCGWADLMVFDGAEVDDCDDERAIYQLALNADEDLLGAVRVRPTEDHGILADKFPELIAEGQPPMKGPDVWEATRVFTTPLYRETRQKGDHLLPLLALAAKEACFYGGAERVVGMVDMQFWAGRTDGPAHVRMTGLPVQYAYGLVGGTVEDLSEAKLELHRESLALAGRAGFLVEDEEFAAFGSLAAIQQAVDDASRLRFFQEEDVEREAQLSEAAREKFDARMRAVASIEAFYARGDAQTAPRSPERITRDLAGISPGAPPGNVA